ncbi:MAG TPA: hypothetical protein VGI73_14655 [Solirubrobacterales bacterium]
MPASPPPKKPAPNPEAVAWYLSRAESLLDELRGRMHSLRARGGQLAGFSAAVITLAGASAGSILKELDGVARSSAAVALLLGTMLLVGAFVAALRGANLPQPASDISIKEIAEYTTDRLIREPDLWRVHLRTTRGFLVLIQLMNRREDEAAAVIEWAGRLFLCGLLSIAVSLCILIVVGGL